MLHSAIVVKKMDAIEGCGLFATQRIAEGELVWELDEPKYSLAEVESWKGQLQRDFKRYGFQCGEDQFSLPRGDSREMNHSCDPNTWWSGSEQLIARRDILVGEEVTYDYATCDIDLGIRMPCNCGAANCRGIVTHRDHLCGDWQKQYGKHLPPHVLASIEAHRRLQP